MQIFSICCVRDEADIIAETLEAALTWSDRIFVLDNGSVDGTWEILTRMAEQEPRIVLDRELGRFHEELRGRVFEQHRHLARPGDWWCRLDADEIYIDDPRAVLAELPRRYGFVLSATFNVYFTERDLAAYDSDPEAWLSRPVHERLRYCQNNWSEGRFVRHRSGLRWGGYIWPPNRGAVARRRMRLRHFQYRSPDQIAGRLRTRQQRPDIFPHEATRTLAVPVGSGTNWVADWLRRAEPEAATWRDRIRPSVDCDFDAGDGNYTLHPELMPALPNVALDAARAAVQSTSLGRAVLRPLLVWRRRRRGGP